MVAEVPAQRVGKDAGGVTLIAADLLRAFPDQVAMVVSAELCSLPLQRNDSSIANVIASCARSGTGEGSIRSVQDKSSATFSVAK
jgi:predicted naringenin-chalcone synthase